MDTKLKVEGYWEFRCFDNEGKLKWEETLLTHMVKELRNLVVDEGLTYILGSGMNTGPFYIALLGTTPAASAGWTMTDITEIQTYDEAARQTWVEAGASSKQITNSASVAVFTISGAATIGGAALCTDNTKGGTSGTLISAKAFTGGDRSLVDNDVLQVTITFTIS